MKKVILFFMITLSVVTYSKMSVYEGDREILHSRKAHGGVRLYPDSLSTRQLAIIRREEEVLRLYKGDSKKRPEANIRGSSEAVRLFSGKTMNLLLCNAR